MFRGRDEESVLVVPRWSGGHRALREGERGTFSPYYLETVEVLTIISALSL